MLYKDAFKIATRNVLTGKMRSILTMLGIVIGIASVIILMSIGQSAQKLILAQVEGVGSNLIVVLPGSRSNSKYSAPAALQGAIITTLQQSDINSLEREPSITAVGAHVGGQTDVTYENKNAPTTYQGVTANMFSIRNFTLKSGTIFTSSDVDAYNHVAVIGPDLALTLFGPYVDPINKTIRLKNVSLRVIGVLSKGGIGAFGIDQGNLVMMPITIAQKEILGISYFSSILVQADPNYDMNFITSRINFDLAQNHGISDPKKYDFSVLAQADILSLVGSITSILTFLLAAIASISLIVGGIGIMNIMLVSVTERTKEIGLLKAVGATNRDIIQQFLVESVLLTFSGGIIGIMTGVGIVALIYGILSIFVPSLGWVLILPVSSVFLSLIVSGIAGITFGLYPANKAAQKNPIDSLRYE